MIFVTSGLPRCGTSLMMQMLDAGGLPVLTDHLRTPDEDNPRGYYELEKAKQIRRDGAWLDEAEGHVFKMVSMLLTDLPTDRRYKVIFMSRNMDELLASQTRMLERQGKSKGPDDKTMQRQFEAHLTQIMEWLNDCPHIEHHVCSYNNLLQDPRGEIDRLIDFLGEPLDKEHMFGPLIHPFTETGAERRPTPIQSGPRPGKSRWITVWQSSEKRSRNTWRAHARSMAA